jgi:hypothetical protein
MPTLRHEVKTGVCPACLARVGGVFLRPDFAHMADWQEVEIEMSFLDDLSAAWTPLDSEFCSALERSEAEPHHLTTVCLRPEGSVALRLCETPEGRVHVVVRRAYKEEP